MWECKFWHGNRTPPSRILPPLAGSSDPVLGSIPSKISKTWTPLADLPPLATCRILQYVLPLTPRSGLRRDFRIRMPNGIIPCVLPLRAKSALGHAASHTPQNEEIPCVLPFTTRRVAVCGLRRTALNGRTPCVLPLRLSNRARLTRCHGLS